MLTKLLDQFYVIHRWLIYRWSGGDNRKEYDDMIKEKASCGQAPGIAANGAAPPWLAWKREDGPPASHILIDTNDLAQLLVMAAAWNDKDPGEFTHTPTAQTFFEFFEKREEPPDDGRWGPRKKSSEEARKKCSELFDDVTIM